MISNSDVGQLIQRTNELLLILVKIHVRPALDVELADTKKRDLYNLTGSSLPIKQISGKLGIATGTISRIWQHWEELGLVVKEGKSYRRVLG